jgi:hypothetical protein
MERSVELMKLTFEDIMIRAYAITVIIFTFLCCTTDWGWRVLQGPYKALLIVVSTHFGLSFVTYIVRDIIEFKTDETEETE